MPEIINIDDEYVAIGMADGSFERFEISSVKFENPKIGRQGKNF